MRQNATSACGAMSNSVICARMRLAHHLEFAVLGFAHVSDRLESGGMDLGGRLWTFTQSVADLSPEEWGAIGA
jgi:hypothetical protein